MDCKQADNLLIDFLYGELLPNDRAAFERHLRGCPEHTREVEKLRAVLNLVRAQEPEEVPAAVSTGILQTARARMPQKPQKPKPAPFFSQIWNPVVAAAVLVAVVITVGLATHFTSEQASEGETAQEAVRPLTVYENPAERAVVTTKAEEKMEPALVPKPEVPAVPTDTALDIGAEVPPAELAPPPRFAEKFAKRPKSKQRRKPASKKRAFTEMPAPIAKTSDTGGLRGKPKPSATTGPGGGKAHKRAEREWKAKDKKKKISRSDEESRFAQSPPPAKAPPAAPLREEIMGAESAAPVAMDRMDLDDGSYAQSPAPRAGKKPPTDYYQAAEADLADKRYEAAVSRYRTFISKNPTDPRVSTGRYRIAKALFLSGRCVETVRAVDTAVSVSPRHRMAPGALLDQGSCYERLNRLSEANATYRRIQRDYPSHRESAAKGMRRTRREVDVKPAATKQHR
jgi:TolA-binding protein